MSEHIYSTSSAASDFRRARQQAVMRDLIGRLTGQTSDLLSFEDVRQKLHIGFGSKRELRDIPIDAIVGSVGRYSDFTRDFLPRNQSARERWMGVKHAVESMGGVPPIEVYQVGDAYFVLDGNHRVSVARQQGASHIQAYVTVLRPTFRSRPTSRPTS